MPVWLRSLSFRQIRKKQSLSGGMSAHRKGASALYCAPRLKKAQTDSMPIALGRHMTRLDILILRLAPFLAMASLSACASATLSAVPDPNSFIAIPGGDREMAEDEPRLIAGSKDRARRTGNNLILHLANGKSRTFHSDNKGCQDGPDHCDGYILIGELPAFHWFAVFETAYAGGRFFLIDDRVGLPTEIPFWPTFSTDGQRLLIQNDDESGFFEGDTLEIWRREGYRME